jgi:hypothetical protein
MAPKERLTMENENKVKALFGLRDDLYAYMGRIGDMDLWLVAYVDYPSQPQLADDARLVVGHTSINNGNAFAHIECCEIQGVSFDGEGKCKGTSRDGFRVRLLKSTPQEQYEVVHSRDVLAALYGFVVCLTADALTS